MDKSDYFKSMLSARVPRTRSAVIDMSNSFTSVGELNIVLDYMYTGNISLSESNISPVLNAACLFLLTDLKLACAEYLMANIVPSTSMSIFSLAEKYNLKKVRDGCLEVIKAWFPFYLCKSKDAIEMSPNLLKVLVNEKVFELMSNDTKKTFANEWRANLKNTTNKAAPLPKEVADWLKAVDSLPQPEGSAAAKNPSGDKVEEVLFTVVVPYGAHSRHRRGMNSLKINCIEVLAFSPSRKTWKSVLRHTFTKAVARSSFDPDRVQNLIGVTEEKAYFLFKHESFEIIHRTEEYVVSVDLESKAERVIKPRVCYEALTDATPKYFLWGTRLCAFFSDDDVAWSLYFNDHDSKCPEKCSEKCWSKMCRLPRESQEIETDLFVTKIYQNNLYVGLLCQECFGKMSVFRISETGKKGKQCKVVEIPSPGGYKDFRCGHYSLNLSCVAYPETSTLMFSITFDTEELLVGLGQTYHKAINYMYDVGKGQWRQKVYGKVTYPEAIPRVLEVSRKIRNEGISDQFYHEEVYTRGFFARSTSPFNTTIWKRENKQWQKVTNAPYPVSAFAFIMAGELRVGFGQALPNATIEDWSKEAGQSPVLNLSARDKQTDFEMEYQYHLGLLCFKSWEISWALMQQGSDDEFSGESDMDTLDDDDMDL